MKAFIAEFENNLNKFAEETKTMMKRIAEHVGKKRTAPEIGETVEIGGMKWLVLDKTEKGYHAITKEFLDSNKKFDEDTNNWSKSELRDHLNDVVLEKIEEDIGEGVLQEFERNLLSLDGQTEYGSCMDKVSLLTVDEYRKYRHLLPNMDKWWWLATPWSTKCNGYEYAVTDVSPSGNFNDGLCYYDFGVRPFCIFPSSIFESEE